MAEAMSPSLAPLLRITRALGVRLGTLLDDDEQAGERRGEAVLRRLEDDGGRARVADENGDEAGRDVRKPEKSAHGCSGVM